MIKGLIVGGEACRKYCDASSNQYVAVVYSSSERGSQRPGGDDGATRVIASVL